MLYFCSKYFKISNNFKIKSTSKKFLIFFCFFDKKRLRIITGSQRNYGFRKMFLATVKIAFQCQSTTVLMVQAYCKVIGNYIATLITLLRFAFV